MEEAIPFTFRLDLHKGHSAYLVELIHSIVPHKLQNMKSRCRLYAMKYPFDGLFQNQHRINTNLMRDQIIEIMYWAEQILTKPSSQTTLIKT